MSLKNVKSLSLVTKLMLLYSLSTMGLISAIGLFLYPTFIKIMEKINGNEASYITAECYEKIIITLLVGSLCAVLFGHFIARKGLNRMREFEDKMEKITANSLHERINLNEWPKELKNFGKKFNTMLDRIQVSFIQLSQFSSDIAHELRTPVNNLRGITEIALSKEKYSDEYKQILEKYMNEYHHLSKLIENLLFLARSDHGQLTLKKETINAQEEILNICDYYRAIADENKIELSCVGNAKLSADPTHFKRIISNLISNALKYTQPNGKISIHIESMDPWAKISIHDTGVGIADEHITRVFDRFYRVDSSRSSQSGGLGLGLAIVKSIVDLHNGNIVLESKLDSGTSVYLQLPSTS
jgi:two-component system heavy metal sensor histidine kinase CusS